MYVYAGYSTMFILIAALPLLMLVVAGVNLMPWFSVEQFMQFVFQFVPQIDSVMNMMEEILRNLNEQSSTFLASVAAVIALYSASSGVSAIQKGLKKIDDDANSSPYDKVFSLLYTILFAAVILTLFLFYVMGRFFREFVHGVNDAYGIVSFAAKIYKLFNVSWIILALILSLLIALIYKFFPGGKRSYMSQMPGALFTAALWILSSNIFSWCIPRFWKMSYLYGSLSSVFLTAMWLYILINILFLGAIMNRILLEVSKLPEYAKKKKEKKGAWRHASFKEQKAKLDEEEILDPEALTIVLPKLSDLEEKEKRR